MGWEGLQTLLANDRGNGRGRENKTTPPQGEDKPSPLLWTSLARRFVGIVARGWGTHPSPRATIKVAPTDHPASYLSSWLRLMAWGGEGKPFAKFVA